MDGELLACYAGDSATWPCPECGDERRFVQPPCVDGHTEDGVECPDWACVECGTALLVGVLPAAREPTAARSAA